MRIIAPWKPDVVEALNRWQHYGFVHEFTCPHHPNETSSTLLATQAGWVCPRCDYTQDWAHDFMLKEQKNPLDRATN